MPPFYFNRLSYRVLDDAAEWDFVILGDRLRLTWLEACEMLPLAAFEEIERTALETARDEYAEAQRTQAGNRQHWLSR